jgi:hypothetical protein
VFPHQNPFIFIVWKYLWLTYGNRVYHIPYLCYGARIAQCYRTGLWAGWLGVCVLVGAGSFSLHHHFQTGSGAHPTSYQMGTRGSFPGGEAARAWGWPLTPI